MRNNYEPEFSVNSSESFFLVNIANGNFIKRYNINVTNGT